MTAHVPHTGFARRVLAELAARLGAEPTPAAVLGARRAAGPAAARRLLAASGLEALLVDTGYPPGATTLAEMRAGLPCAVHEIVRVEACAERLLPAALPYEAFLDALRAELEAGARRGVALKSIIAYRSGLAVRAWPPAEARAAYRRELARSEAGRPPRLTEPALLDTLFVVALEVARDAGRPLQVHTGLGDPDIDLLRANPLLLRPLLEDPRWAAVPVVLLHLAYPYAREAAFMAAVWPQVHVDLSLALPLLGPAAVGLLAEVLALAPATKVHYGSDLRGLPELFALAADWARDALGRALATLVEARALTRDEARAVGRRVLADNARALYRLPPSA